MVAVSWFLIIGMVCYLGSMFYTLVLAIVLDDDSSDSLAATSSAVDHSTDETLSNYGARTPSVAI
ncbi:MAG: hypothetical protein ABI537_15480 [Casimicrobiaceae bacterium]